MMSMSLPLIIVFVLCPVVLLSLLRFTAPYGRHFVSGWGPSLSNRPAWILMEIPAVVVIAALVLTQPGSLTPGVLVPLALWEFHYLYRTVIFPALMRPSQRTFPVLLVGFAVIFNVLNGYNNAQALNEIAVLNTGLISIHFIAGSLIFMTGFFTSVRSSSGPVGRC
jgi:hypothetical protein